MTQHLQIVRKDKNVEKIPVFYDIYILILMLLPCSAAAVAPAASRGSAAAEEAAAAGESGTSKERVVLALDADPYLEEYCPNLLKGDTQVTYDVVKYT